MIDAAPPPLAVGVGLREFQVALYRAHVPARRRLKLNVSNLGADPHDLVVRRRSTGREIERVPELRPGERTSVRLRLRRRGRYVFFCSIADHEEQGMTAVLRVRRPR